MSLEIARRKMADAGATDLAIDVFAYYYDQLAQGETGFVPEDSIEPLDSVPSLTDVDVSDEEAREALSRTVILKLNGGLGSSMGMERAKSLLPVRDGLTFLDIISRQVRHVRDTYGARLPIMFMNSFRTREDTLAALPDDLAVDLLPLDFVQGQEPKLTVDDLAPVTWDADPSLEWCPPGHGDIYTTLTDQGIVEQLLDAGFKYLATSNADNLGASPDPRLAGWFAQSGSPYSPEVCLRTPADRKGGHLARRRSDGRVILRETAQTPAEDMDYFTDEHRHRYFHTNNLWFNLEALHELLVRTGGLVKLPLIRNDKTVDPTDPSSTKVHQIECAIGAIVEQFEGATPIVVPRSRFLPVKTTNDLLLLRSDAYTLGADGTLSLVPPKAPLVDVDPTYYKLIKDFDQRFQVVPSLRDVSRFSITGDWTFATPVAFSGEVSLQGTGSFMPASRP